MVCSCERRPQGWGQDWHTPDSCLLQKHALTQLNLVDAVRVPVGLGDIRNSCEGWFWELLKKRTQQEPARWSAAWCTQVFTSLHSWDVNICRFMAVSVEHHEAGWTDSIWFCSAAVSYGSSRDCRPGPLLFSTRGMGQLKEPLPRRDTNRALLAELWGHMAARWKTCWQLGDRRMPWKQREQPCVPAGQQSCYQFGRTLTQRFKKARVKKSKNTLIVSPALKFACFCFETAVWGQSP